MSIVRHDDRPVLTRGPRLPTLQRLVDRASGSDAVTVLINVFSRDQAVPEHTHEVEEVLLVTAGECTVTVDGRPQAARTGDAVIIEPGGQPRHQPRFWRAVRGDRRPCLSRRADRRGDVTRLGHRPGRRSHRHPEAAYNARSVQAAISRLRSALTWRNEVERRVSGRVRVVSGAVPIVVA